MHSIQHSKLQPYFSSVLGFFFRASPTFLFPWRTSCVWVTLRMWLYADEAGRLSVTGIHCEEEDVGHLEGRAGEGHRLSCVDRRHYMIIPCVWVGVFFPAVLSRGKKNALMRSSITKPFHSNGSECSLPVWQAGRGGIVNSEVTLVQLCRMWAGIVVLSLSFLSFLKKKIIPHFQDRSSSPSMTHTSQSIDYAPSHWWKPVLTQEALLRPFYAYQLMMRKVHQMAQEQGKNGKNSQCLVDAGNVCVLFLTWKMWQCI